MSILRGLAGLVLPVTGTGALIGCQTASSTAAPALNLTRPQWQMGQRWQYQLMDGFNAAVLGKPQYRVTATALDIEIAVEQKIVERYNAQMQLLAEDTFGENVQYNRPVNWFTEGGKGNEQQSSTRYVNNSTPAHWWRQKVTVLGVESVTVPAGTYNCALIQRTIYFEHPDRFRSQSQRVDKMWYAPEVKRWVQRETRGSYLDSADIDDKGGSGRRQEDWRIWQLLSYTAPPISG